MTDQDDESTADKEDVQEGRLWQDKGWSAKVVKNEEDEGWAVEITQDGNPEPVLVAPWTMGRDKKNPKPLDANSFHTWIKTAKEVLGRHRQQLHARLNKAVVAHFEGQRVRFEMEITPSEDEPYATLRAIDPFGQEMAKAKAPASFKLSEESALAWAKGGFRSSGSNG